MPSTITGEKWAVSVDILTTGLVLGVWQDIQVGLNTLGEYWDYAASLLDGQMLNALYLLRDFVEKETAGTRSSNESLIQSGNTPRPIEVQTYKIKKFLEVKAVTGCVDIPLQTKSIAELMRKLGFTLQGDRYVEME